MRALWAGEAVSSTGHVVTKSARLHSRPARLPLLCAAAITADTARWAGGWADGLITVPGPRDTRRKAIESFREGGGATEHQERFIEACATRILPAFAPVPAGALAS